MELSTPLAMVAGVIIGVSIGILTEWSCCKIAGWLFYKIKGR